MLLLICYVLDGYMLRRCRYNDASPMFSGASSVELLRECLCLGDDTKEAGAEDESDVEGRLSS